MQSAQGEPDEHRDHATEKPSDEASVNSSRENLSEERSKVHGRQAFAGAEGLPTA